MAIHAYPAFGTKTADEIKRGSARSITIELKDRRKAWVDDDLCWYADDQDVFNDVIPVAEDWPNDDYYPLPLLRAHSIATWVAAKMGGRVVTPAPKYTKKDYEVPPGAVA